MNKYLLSLLAICFFYLANAQTVTTTCGTDTIILEVDNYKNGIIAWEESLDSITWLSIDGENAKSYKFFPTETKYYRASVTTSECDPLYSAITLVQLPPTSYAGADRECGGTTTKLMGSTEIGSMGTWSILKGENGSISEVNNPNSAFIGEYNQSYQLLWTVSNGCGQSNDTVTLTFEEIKAKNNFIVVDNTDIIFSDSAERAEGIYRIQFSDSTIVPNDTMLLIGMREDISFIVNIVSFTKKDNIYEIITTDGSLESIIQSGPVNIGDGVNQSMVDDGKKSTSNFPTRETLKSYAKNKNQLVIYSSNYSDQYGNRVAVSRKKKGSTGLTLSIPDMDLFSSPDGLISASIENTYVRIEPNFVCDLKIVGLSMQDIKIGIDNGEFEYNYKFIVQATAAKEYSEEVELFELSNNTVFMAGPVPIVVSTSFKMIAAATLTASAILTVEQEKNYQKNFTALLKGDKVKNVEFVSFSSSKTTTQSDYNVQGRLDAEFSIGPEISVELYKAVGPYFALPLTLGMGICVNKNMNWDASASLGIEGNLGVRAHLGDWTLFDMQHTLFKSELMKPLVLPYKMTLLAGNSQKGLQEQVLPYPIKLKVTSNYGFGVPFVPVRLNIEEGNGWLNNDVLFTDLDGKVTIDDWTLGTNATSQLEISVLNCDDEDIEINSPLTAYAYTVYDCSKSNLAISFNKTENTFTPIVTGGTAPYSYSTNGSDFSTNVPAFDNLIEGSFMVYVKDDNYCSANKAITIKIPDPCVASPLFIDVYAEANTFQLSGIGGYPPYQFSIDNLTNFTASKLFSNLAEGKHIVYVKDAKDCIASDKLWVEHFDANAINAIEPKNNAKYYNASNVNFLWQTGLYAENQLCDLYLAKEGETFKAIAENLSIDQYTDTSSLAFNTLYHWKIMVKDENGLKKDSSIFSFTTMADPSIVIQKPTLLQPADSAIVNDSVTLKWKKQLGDFKYDVYLDNSLVAFGLTTDSLCLNDLTPSMAYQWKVIIRNIVTNESLESSDQTFEIKSLLPIVTTNVIMKMRDTSAICGGNVLSEGLAPVTERGICWSIYGNPTIDSTHSILSADSSYFEDTIFGLQPDTIYYVRAYAINSNGISYGVMESFRTMPPIPKQITFNIYMAKWYINMPDAGGNTELGGWVKGTVLNAANDVIAEHTFYSKGETDFTDKGWHTNFNAERSFAYVHTAFDEEGLVSAIGYKLKLESAFTEYDTIGVDKVKGSMEIDLGDESLFDAEKEYILNLSGNGSINMYFNISIVE